jgi:hypothetical protein
MIEKVTDPNYNIGSLVRINIFVKLYAHCLMMVQWNRNMSQSRAVK